MSDQTAPSHPVRIPYGRLVRDRLGGLWQHYNDVGWVKLVTVSAKELESAPTLADLEEREGPLIPVRDESGVWMDPAWFIQDFVALYEQVKDTDPDVVTEYGKWAHNARVWLERQCDTTR